MAGPYARPGKAPTGGSTDAIELGRALFFDPRLSASGIVSCATCHNPAFSWGDGLPRAVGHGMKTLGRRTPTILNVAWGGPFMWDGRFETLEIQALGPITSPGEMNMPAEELVKKLAQVEGYRTRFAKVFGQGPITAPHVAEAIAAFEKTIVSTPAPFDRWLGGNPTALNESAKRGFVLFNGKAACSKCHSGWRLTDDSFHDIGVADADEGRGALPDMKDFVTLQHAFKTPTLRNIDQRGPYLHDGSAKTLEDVVALYEAGGNAARPSLSEEVRPFTLTAAERADLVSFLKSLTSDCSTTMPMLPR